MLAVRTNAVLPTDRTHIPHDFWDAQAGGGYVHQFGDGWSTGGAVNVGTASDRPFNSLNESVPATARTGRITPNPGLA